MEGQLRWGIEDNSEKCFSFHNKNICCDPSLELSHRDSSNEGSQQMFLSRNMENNPSNIPVTPSYMEH